VRPARRLVLALSLLLVTSLAAYVWQTPRPVSFTPARAAGDVSTQTEIRLQFSRALAEPLPQMRLSPPAEGIQRYQENTLIFVPDQPLAPATSYAVTIEGDVSGLRGACLFCGSLRWQFETASPAILYATWDAANQPQLVRKASADDDAEVQQLTAAPLGINDYDVSPRGDTIIYSARREDGGSDLWLTGRSGQGARQLLSCPGAACDGASWAPDGRRLVFVRRLLTDDGRGAPRLYWLDAQTGDNQPVFVDETHEGLFPRFSANGEWLAFIEPGPPPSVLAYPLGGGPPQLLPGETATPVAWHPHEDRFLSSVIIYEGERITIHLFEVAVNTRALEDVSGDVSTEDGGAAWSPAGDWIAFARKVARTPVGSQVWLMRPGGSEARPLTSDPDSNFSSLSWSPDGQQLLVQRFAIGEGSEPEIWLLEPATSKLAPVAAPGIRPAWLP
jgi:dipeptidyl aminopeptidase/acylaminoacyl peptidase